MFGFMKMLRGVFVFGRIAAANVSANHAEPQVNPRIAGFEALFAAICMWLDVLNLIHMRTFAHVRCYYCGENRFNWRAFR